MPVTNAPVSPTQNATTLPLMGMAAPAQALQAPQFQFNALPQNLSADPASIQRLLSQPQTSLTNTIMPYLMQLYGASSGITQNMFQQQGAQAASAAQSDAMKRGLTGSSIEEAGIVGARASADQAFAQYLASILPQLGQQAMGATQFDITQQNTQVQDLAQMLGQEYAQNIQQEQFNRMLQENMAQAARSNKFGLESSLIQGLTSAGGTAALMKFAV